MNEELKKLVEETYLKIKEGLKPEQNKLEIKSKWNNLSKTGAREDLHMFLKELVSIANTFGLRGCIIYGINEDTGEITNSPFVNSGLKDKVDLHNLVVKHVDRMVDFEVEEIQTDIDGELKTLSVVLVPLSLSKPHVIREYYTSKGNPIQNYVPVRKSTGVFPATKEDFDLMYYDRGNVIPEYALNIKKANHFAIRRDTSSRLQIQGVVVFENYGRKPIVILKCDCLISSDSKDNGFAFKLGNYAKGYDFINAHYIDSEPLIIPSNMAVAFNCTFHPENSIAENFFSENILLGGNYFFSGTDIFKKVYYSE